MHENLDKLLELCCENNRNAQEAIYKSYADRLANVAYRYSKSESAVPDILQNAFIKIFQSIKTFSGNSNSFYPWALRITINEALMWLRKNNSRMISEESRRESIDGENLVLGKLQTDEILKIVQTLEHDDQVIINLAIVDDLDHKSIAQILKISTSHSRTRLTRARKKLQQLIQRNLHVII